MFTRTSLLAAAWWTRQFRVAVAVMGLLAVCRPATAGEVDAPAMSPVRSSEPAIVALIAQATEQSQTFRGLVETISRHDGIVYVQEGVCSHGARACLVDVTQGGRMRLLWVKVDTHRADWDVMGSIGHELRHTIEVLETPWVTNCSAMISFYQKFTLSPNLGNPETAAAKDAGHRVRSEIQRYRRAVAH